ncbi:uncharacterized protein LOC132269782 [Cornus florida]|uniref:uncharacterized protein LOC132269782 n=1 Tax=Cornus florida TaxID=4283 RepID=UPI002898BA4B|nr:uncharacterized protein LOC132269782 [Cornus florida]
MAPKKRSGKGVTSVVKTFQSTVVEETVVTVVRTKQKRPPRGEKEDTPLKTIPVEDTSQQVEREEEEEEEEEEEVSDLQEDQEVPTKATSPPKLGDPQKKQEEEEEEKKKKKKSKARRGKGRGKKTTQKGKRNLKERRKVGGGGGVGYKRYVYKVMKQVHPDMGISSKAMTILNNFMTDMFERLAGEGAKLTDYSRRRTLSSREIQGAVKLVLPGELGKHAMVEGTKAVTNYLSYTGGRS